MDSPELLKKTRVKDFAFIDTAKVKKRKKNPNTQIKTEHEMKRYKKHKMN